MLAAACTIRNRPTITAVCGPDLFGLAAAEIAMRVQALPNADLCKRYKWQTFVPSGRGGAAAAGAAATANAEQGAEGGDNAAAE